MANPEHLKIIKQGVKAWNEWREKNRFLRPDLSQVNLSKANLSNVNLEYANLSKANLSKTNLTEANLTYANLAEVNLTESILNGANLSYADLFLAKLTGAILTWTKLYKVILNGANLTGANLRGANLEFANLRGAILIRTTLAQANFENVYMGYTTFASTNLNRIKNLEKCNHFSKSNFDISTLTESGKLPLPFLRGIGLSDSMIDYLLSLVGEGAIQFYSCFISYSSKDEDFAKRLHVDLQDNGIRCWFAPEDMKIGDKIRQTIDQSIKMYDKLLLILSKESINSTWVEKEVETAFDKENKTGKTVLFPIRFDNAVMETDLAWAADIRRTRHIGDFRNWKNPDDYKKSFDRLLKDLKQNLKK